MSAVALARIDSYQIEQDKEHNGSPSRFSALGGIEIRWPLREVGSSSKLLIEPFAQLVWAPKGLAENERIPDEDSRFIEFDETNLLSLNRFPGRDRVEGGTRVNFGVKVTGEAESGTRIELVAGQILRRRDLEQFSEESGLAGSRSAFVASARADFPGGSSVDQRVVLDNDFGIVKSESFFSYVSNTYEISFGYARLAQDEDKGMKNDFESAAFSVKGRLSGNWTVEAGVEYDFNKQGKNIVTASAQYQRQCLLVVMRVERLLKTENRPEADTKLHLNLTLGGFRVSDIRSPSECGSNGITDQI